MKLTEEDFGHMNLLHRCLTRGEQVLQRFGGLELAIYDADVFEGHGEGRVHEGAEHEGTIRLDVRQGELSPEPGGHHGFSERNGGIS